MTDRDADHAAAARADGYYNRWYLDPLLRGAYPTDLRQAYAELQALPTESARVIAAAGPARDETPGMLPVMEETDLDTIGQRIDFLGVTYYFRRIVQSGHEHRLLGFSSVRATDDAPPRERTSMGWEIFAEGLGELVQRIYPDYGPTPLYITENGAAFDDVADDQGIVADDRRVEYLRSHIWSLSDTIAAGVAVRGDFAWSLLDNFEWDRGYGQRFGLVRVDYDSGRRIPKASAHWYRSLIAGGGEA